MVKSFRLSISIAVTITLGAIATASYALNTNTPPQSSPPPKTNPIQTHIVGEDITGGMYDSRAQPGKECSISRYSSLTPSKNTLIATESARGRILWQVFEESDMLVVTEGCSAPSAALQSVSEPLKEFTDKGRDLMWRVGAEVQAGTYRLLQPGEYSKCRWYRLSYSTATSGHAIIESGGIGDVVTLSDRGEILRSNNCGAWQYQESS